MTKGKNKENNIWLIALATILFLYFVPPNFMNTKLPLLAVLAPAVPLILYLENKKFREKHYYWSVLGIIICYLLLVKTYFIIF